MSQESIDYFNNLSTKISFYFGASTTSIGIILTTITSVIFFCNKKLNKTRMGYMYGILSVIYTICLLLSFFLVSFLPNFNPKYSFMLISDASCKAFFISIRIAMHLSSWFQVYMTVDRFIDVKYPNRFNSLLNSRRFINGVLISIFTCCVLVNIPNSLFYVLVGPSSIVTANKTIDLNGTISFEMMNSTIEGSRSCQGDFSVQFAAEMITASMRTWFPMIFLLIFNLLTIALLKKSSQRVHSNNPNSSRQKRFTLAVLTLNGIFFIFNFPLSLSFILRNVLTNKTSTRVIVAQINLFHQIGIAVSFLYYSLAFPIHLVSNSIFRKEVLNFFFKLLRLKTNNSTTAQRSKTGRSQTQM